MSRPADLHSTDEILIERDLPIDEKDLVELRRAVGWPAEGDYHCIVKENVFHIGARSEGRLVGFVQVVGSPNGDLLIHDFCVHPDFQGRGVGRKLMETTIEICRNMAPQGVNVLFEERNRKFFESLGFKVMYGGYMDNPTLSGDKKK